MAFRQSEFMTSEIDPLFPAMPKTQKARGIVYASQIVPEELGLSQSEYVVVFPFKEHNYGTARSDLKFLLTNESVFARPCPTRPRHGFVESQLVRSFEDIFDVISQTLAQDPNGEVVFMPRLSGLWSGVATNAGVTWAAGNDGVTSGKSKSLFIPAPAATSLEWNDWNSVPESEEKIQEAAKALDLNLYRSYAITKMDDYRRNLIYDTAYVELVENNGNSTVVQFRDGPAQSVGIVDVIPRETVAQYILYAKNFNDDLLSWEKVINTNLTFADDPSRVVLVCPGMALSSHFCVHGIEKGCTVITSRDFVAYGETITPVETKRKKRTAKDYAQIAKRMREIESENFIKRSRPAYVNSVLATVVGTIQVSPQWEPEPHLIELMAYAPIALARFLLAACAGEVRHSIDPPPQLTEGYGDRNTIYHHQFRPLSLATIEELLSDAEAVFDDYDQWDEDKDGYGGDSWAQVARHARSMVEKTRTFMDSPTAANWSRLIISANTAINTAHNNGAVVNKWFGHYGLSAITNAPAMAFMGAFAAEVTMRFINGNA